MRFMLSSAHKAVAAQIGSLLLAASVIVLLGMLYPLEGIVRWLQLHVRETQPWSMIFYPLLQATCNLLLLPGGVLIVASGFFFGLWRGFFLVLAGHLIGAAAAFGVTRTLGRAWVERCVSRHPRWSALDRAIEREGWKIVFLSQLNPLFPTSLMNYGYGLTRMRFWPCMGWIALGQAPGMFFYVYVGRLGHFGYKLWRDGADATGGQYLIWIGGLAASLLLTLALGQVAVRLLREVEDRAKGDVSPATVALLTEHGETAPLEAERSE